MAMDVGPNRSAIGKFGGYKPQGMGMRPPNPMDMGGPRPPMPPRMPNPGMPAGPAASFNAGTAAGQDMSWMNKPGALALGPGVDAGPSPSMVPPPPMPPPNMGPPPPMTPSSFTGNQQGGGFLPGGMPPTGPQGPPPMMPPPQTGGIDTAPVGYVDPNNASIPNIRMGNMGQNQGASRMGGLRNAYAGAGPNLSTRPFNNKLFY